MSLFTRREHGKVIVQYAHQFLTYIISCMAKEYFLCIGEVRGPDI